MGGPRISLIEPERTVIDNVVVSARDPRVRLELERPITYAGAARWALYGVADCEVHVFLDADAHRQVKRLYWIQFEAYLPHVSASYRYDSPARVTLGGLEFIVDGGLARSDAPYRRPGSDREHVHGLVNAAGYRLPPEMMTLRMVHLPDAAKRKELMIIYAEDLAGSGCSLTDLSEGGRAAHRWPEIEAGLRERAVAGLRLSR